MTRAPWHRTTTICKSRFLQTIYLSMWWRPYIGQLPYARADFNINTVPSWQWDDVGALTLDNWGGSEWLQQKHHPSLLYAFSIFRIVHSHYRPHLGLCTHSVKSRWTWHEIYFRKDVKDGPLLESYRHRLGRVIYNFEFTQRRNVWNCGLCFLKDTFWWFIGHRFYVENICTWLFLIEM